MNGRFYIVVLVLLNGIFLNAQNSPYIAQTKMTLQSVDKNDKSFDANSDNAYLILNTTTGDLTLTADASGLRTGNRILDSILDAKGPQPIVFKGNISENLFLFNQQVNDEKMYNVPGKLTINNITIDCIGQFDPINYGDKSDPKNYRIDLKLMIVPVKGIISGLENQINKQLYFEVKGGLLNIQQ